jgi:hypothetical protein
VLQHTWASRAPLWFCNLDRKKELSTHNETLADDFKDAITESLQTAVDCVGEFADDQTGTLGGLREQIGRMILARQEVMALCWSPSFL